jgi:8-oxo-dGTP pyrophosphatase MutT (NUDIX family)
MASAFVFTVCVRNQTWLAQLRSATSKHPLTWGLPGGRIEPNERPLEAACREFWEEVGVKPPRSELHPIVQRGGRTLYVWPVAEQFSADPTAPMAHESVTHAWFPLRHCPAPATKWLAKMHKEAVRAFDAAKQIADETDL